MDLLKIFYRETNNFNFNIPILWIFSHVIKWLWKGFELVFVFTELLELVTASKDCALTVLHISQITIGNFRSSKSVTIFICCSSVVASIGGRSPSPGFQNRTRPQLLPSYSNSSYRLNPRGYLARQPTQLNSTRLTELTPHLSPCL